MSRGRPIRWSMARHMRLPFALACLLGASAYVAHHGRAAHEEAVYLLGKMRDNRERLREERAALIAYESRFRELREAGVIDDEPRLAWVEAVQRSANGLGLSAVTFQLEPGAPYAFAHPGVDASLRASAMKLHFHVAHEGEWIDFLAHLRAATPALSWLRYCTLDRRSNAFTPHGKNLEGECELLWLVFDTAGDQDSPP